MSELLISQKQVAGKDLVWTPTAYRQIERNTNSKDQVGALVSDTVGPVNTTSYTAMTTIFTATVLMVANYQYQITMNLSYAQQITNASANAQIQCTVGTVNGSPGPLMNRLLVVGSPGVNGYLSGSASRILAVNFNVTAVFTVTAFSAAASLQVQANGVELIVTRVL